MHLRLPRSLHYPITVTKLLKPAGSKVAKSEPLFLYTYETTVREGSRSGEEIQVKKAFPATFESDLEGQLKIWRIREGEILGQPIDAADIEEECPHSEQYAGMCTNCGKDMTIVSSFNSDNNDADRAPFQSSHDTQKLLISKNEASRREEEAKKRLLASRKLSLVVDLDQTIIHAAVDPTIAEWQKDKSNPNYEAVKDVRAFQLIDDSPGMRGCWYYIKLRPGLEDFLKHISQLYELHIYTMGTRAYAEKIAELVDPDRIYFSDRILSRDESGSATIKTLERLFPIDTKMVVIIDDRGDVWKWNSNLVRVIPFDFFVGIGDINSSFLPKKQDIKIAPKADHVEETKLENPGVNGDVSIGLVEDKGTVVDDGPRATTNGTDTSALEQLVAMGGSDDPVIREIQTKGQAETIITQLEEKPLLQMQKKLDAKDQAAAVAAAVAQDETSTNATVDRVSRDSTPPKEPSSPVSKSNGSEPYSPGPPEPPVRHSLLRNDDRELESLSTRLSSVHSKFYSEYDRHRSNQKGGRVAALSSKGRKIQLQPDLSSPEDASDLLFVPDVKKIMPVMKSRALSTVTLVFSGVLPLDTNVQTADISLWAKTFGATIAEKVGKGVTHVVAARAGTTKVKQGVKKGLWVVNLQWLIACMTTWQRVPEEAYVLQDLPQEGDRRKQPAPGEGEPGGQDTDDRQDLIQEPKTLLSSDEGEDETTGPETEAETDEAKLTPTNPIIQNPDQRDEPNRKRLKLDTHTPSSSLVNGYNDNENENTMDDASPLSINQDEWAEMDKELQEFMGSDADDNTSDDDYQGEDDDGEGDRGGDRDEGEEKAVGENSGRLGGIRGSGKRKREESVVSNGEVRQAKAQVEKSQKQADIDEGSSDDELARELERELDRSSDEE